MVVRDYELLTLREVREPSTPAYICLPSYQYAAAERVFRISSQQRAASLGFWDARTIASLNNWVTTLIKLKEYGRAAEKCRKMLNALQDRDESPYFIIMKCNLAACLVLSKQKEESVKVLDYLRERHMLVQFDIAVEAYFEALSMTCRTGHNCMVLRESDDRAPGVVRIYDYVTQGNDQITVRDERKPLLDQKNLPYRSENTFSARLSKSHRVQQIIYSLRRTTSLLLRPSQIRRFASTTLSLETDIQQEAAARLDSFIATPSPADRKSLAALVDAFEFGLNQHATEQQVAENFGTTVHLDTLRLLTAKAAPWPPVTQSLPESQVFQAYSRPSWDQKLLESRVSQAGPTPGGTGMSPFDLSHRPYHIGTEATLKARVDAPRVVHGPGQHNNKQLVSSTTENPSRRPQAFHGNLMVEAWLECQKAIPPVPDMSPRGGPPSNLADATIGLTYRTIDTTGSSVRRSTFAFGFMNLIHDCSKSPT
jgi:hypothetical protein